MIKVLAATVAFVSFVLSSDVAAQTLVTQTINVEDYSSLKAINRNNLRDNARAIVGGHRNGTFSWRSGDQDANCTADPQEGIWVKPAAEADCTNGAWERDVVRDFDAAWWGFSESNNGTQNSTALDAALAYARDSTIGILDSTDDTVSLAAVRTSLFCRPGDYTIATTATVDLIRFYSSSPRACAIRYSGTGPALQLGPRITGAVNYTPDNETAAIIENIAVLGGGVTFPLENSLSAGGWTSPAGVTAGSIGIRANLAIRQSSIIGVAVSGFETGVENDGQWTLQIRDSWIAGNTDFALDISGGTMMHIESSRIEAADVCVRILDENEWWDSTPEVTPAGQSITFQNTSIQKCQTKGIDAENFASINFISSYLEDHDLVDGGNPWAEFTYTGPSSYGGRVWFAGSHFTGGSATTGTNSNIYVDKIQSVTLIENDFNANLDYRLDVGANGLALLTEYGEGNVPINGSGNIGTHCGATQSGGTVTTYNCGGGSSIEEYNYKSLNISDNAAVSYDLTAALDGNAWRIFDVSVITNLTSGAHLAMRAGSSGDLMDIISEGTAVDFSVADGVTYSTGADCSDATDGALNIAVNTSTLYVKNCHGSVLSWDIIIRPRIEP